VVCGEFEDTLRSALAEYEAGQEQRAREKREKRIYGNWKTLIKGLRIRQRLRNRYGEGKTSFITVPTLIHLALISNE